ncbi:MAG: cytochrome bd ubiquinol oxidase subunit [Actinomycetota bacterium]|jgi:cytochrome d ubiquinol oxidase subunit II|nr:cytochrome bd ubiquinol oxidase subunit [Actinomycetota bacterium]
MSNLVAGGLLLGVLAYAVFGGADFGAGFWDLTAGGAERGRAKRALIDHSLGPVWEANHTWLIYCLVVLWTAFPRPFAAIMTTLYVPLGLAALGIVLRGSGFAFRKVVVSTETQRVNGAAFAASSVITPFFLGAVAGGIASGRVPPEGYGDPVTSWANPSSALTGALAVTLCAYLAGVFLTADARAEGDPALETDFRRRALAAAWVAGALTIGGLWVAHTDAPRLFDRLLTGPGLPAVVLSVLAGTSALLLLRRNAPRSARLLSAAAVACVVGAWGVAQYPYLLGTHSTVAASAAPRPSLVVLTIIFALAAVLVVPSFGLLYVLQQRGRLSESSPASG